MAGDGVVDGDYVIVTHGSEPHDGDIVVVRVGGPDDSEAIIRRVWHEGTTIRLESSNPDFAPLILRADDSPIIEGKVIAVVRPLPGLSAHSDDAFAVRVREDAMAGDGVVDGDYVTVTHGSEPHDGDIVVVRVGGP